VARDYDELIDEAYEALEQARYEDALEMGREAIEADPDSAPGHYLTGAALVEVRQFEEAIPYLRNALDIDPAYPDARYCLATAQYATGHFTAARHELRRVLSSEPRMADAHYLLGLCMERQRRWSDADASLRRAVELAPDRFHAPCRLPREEFDRAVREAVGLLPEYFRRYLEGVQVVVDDIPSEDLLFEADPPLEPELFGLFSGVPLVERSLMDTVPVNPDRIHLFQRNLERFCDSRERLVEEIRVTLLHEVGHAMGLDDDGLDKLGYA
jgi:predicted Zn-dependent protease with MMP-like domain